MSHTHDEPTTAVPETPAPIPEHVRTIARLSRWLGLGLWAAAFVAAWLLLAWVGWTAFWVAAFASLYGMCIWLAAGDTLSPIA